jgi:hypothetical protein
MSRAKEGKHEYQARGIECGGLAPGSVSVGNAQVAVAQHQHARSGGAPVIEAVRDALERYKDPDAALAAGYVAQPVCVSGPEKGAMGVHFVKPPLFDGVIELEEPEALVYEPKQGGLQLVAVEYIAPAAAWHATHQPGDQPQLEGHLFHYVSGPNRYGPDAFYELHVWAWKLNASGTFADWNPSVSCVRWEGQ